MTYLIPILLALVYGFVMYKFSAWRSSQALKTQSTPLRDGPLQALCARFAQALDVPVVQVFIYETPMINGLAAPDGRIYLTRGFMDQYKTGRVTAQELGAVIAHEMGHVALGHSRRRMIDFSGQNAMRVGIAMVLARFLPGIGPLIAGGLTSLLAARLSRKDEFEADAYATALLMASGVGAEPQITLFEKLDQLAGSGGDQGLAWLRSHPKTTDRIAAIRRNMA